MMYVLTFIAGGMCGTGLTMVVLALCAAAANGERMGR